RWEDGTPAQGIWISVINPGNNPLGPPVETDEQGHATWLALDAQPGDVYVATTKITGGRRVAAVDLRKGDGRRDLTVPRKREAVVHVFLDGKPGIPEGLWTSFGPTELSEYAPISRDETTGIVRFSYWPALGQGSFYLWVRPIAGWRGDRSVVI